MAYNLYQVQQANAWAQRIDKENALAEKFWAEQAMKGLQTSPASVSPKGQGTHYHRAPPSVAASSAAPTGYTSKSAALMDRLTRLENALEVEKQHRQKVEEELMLLRTQSP